jgi:hypothetical protein
MKNLNRVELLLTREMPFGKYKGRIIADLPGIASTGSRVRVFRPASAGVSWH